jgi:hypothetical protein
MDREHLERFTSLDLVPVQRAGRGLFTVAGAAFAF